MKAYVGITDLDWYEQLAATPNLDELNFWRPGETPFKALSPGQPFLFKLHSPDNYIVGGGFFVRYSLLPVSFAWDAFGEKNGARSLQEMRSRIAKYRRRDDSLEDYQIGCIVLVEPFFFSREHWIPAPADFAANIVSGKSYALDQPVGRKLWEQVAMARAATRAPWRDTSPDPAVEFAWGLAKRRLGQGAFRVDVTEAYGRRCAVTGERTLPVLDAAHIRPVGTGSHAVRNGILMRQDIHTLFDRGYVTVRPDMRFAVSSRLSADWSNGRIYYDLDGRLVRTPEDESCRPDRAALEWHSSTIFRGAPS